MLQLLDGIRKRFDLAMLFITHDLRAAAQIRDRIMVMPRGKVVEAGETRTVDAAPANPCTKAFRAADPGLAAADVLGNAATPSG